MLQSPRSMVLWPLFCRGVLFWFEHKGGNKSSLRMGQGGWCLQLQSCRGRPGPGPVQAALRRSPRHTAISLSHIASAPERPQDASSRAACMQLRVPAAHQLASGPAEYFRVESPFSSSLHSLCGVQGQETVCWGSGRQSG